MKKILYFGIFTSISTGMAYSDEIKSTIIQYLTQKTKEIVQHELKQDYIIELATVNLERVIIDHALKNQSVINVTAGLVDKLFHLKTTQEFCKELLDKGFYSHGIQGRVTEVFEYRAQVEDYSLHVSKRIRFEDDLEDIEIMDNNKKE